MKATSFNTGWTCRHLGSSAPGTPVTLPHDAMLAEERSQTSAGGTNPAPMATVIFTRTLRANCCPAGTMC